MKIERTIRVGDREEHRSIQTPDGVTVPYALVKWLGGPGEAVPPPPIPPVPANWAPQPDLDDLETLQWEDLRRVTATFDGGAETALILSVERKADHYALGFTDADPAVGLPTVRVNVATDRIADFFGLWRTMIETVERGP